jgi:DNA-binding NarL/FixJ family response regulator
MKNETENYTKVWIVDDDAHIRTGFSFILESATGFRCSVLKNAEEALALFERTPPDVILMDINLPGVGGIECCRRIKAAAPAILIMMCTVLEDTDKIFEALRAGATGYLLKKTAGKLLIESINDMLNGGAPMSSEIARKVVGFFAGQADPDQQAAAEPLSRRELEVLDLLAKGYGNKRIAEELYVSVHTVRSHIYNIYDKLHVHNKVEALNKYQKRIAST